MNLPVGKIVLRFFNENLFPQTEARGITITLHAILTLFRDYSEGVKFQRYKVSQI